MADTLTNKILRRIKRVLLKKRPLFGLLLPLQPVSRAFGSDRGLPIDRYYIEKFLEENRDAIRGDVLEAGDPRYTNQFGSGVRTADILHLTGRDAKATLAGDLSRPETLPENRYDCFLCTQTFHYIFDLEKGVLGARRLLKPGGILLATLPAVSRKSVSEKDAWTDYWRFTSASAKRIFEKGFGAANVEVRARGNVLAAAAFLYGFAAEEISRKKLNHQDPDYEMLITVKARKEKI